MKKGLELNCVVHSDKMVNSTVVSCVEIDCFLFCPSHLCLSSYRYFPELAAVFTQCAGSAVSQEAVLGSLLQRPNTASNYT